MTFPRSSAELIKNTSTVSPDTLPTVKDALDNLETRSPTLLPVPITEGGTGETTANAAFNALSPTTTRGDLIYRNATVNARLGIGAPNTILRSNGTDVAWSTLANLGSPAPGLDADTVDGLHASSFALTTAVREKLTANRTYYVSTTGSDSNDGLTVSTPFLTIQKAVNVVLGIDRGVYSVTIQLADGTYSAGASIGIGVGAGTFTIQGNSSTPGNVVVATVGTSFSVANSSVVVLRDMQISSTNGWCITSQYSSVVFIVNLRFGAAPLAGHMYCNAGGGVIANGDYSIVGAAAYHWYAENAGIIRVTGRTITITGTPAFSVFAVCATVGSMTVFTNTFSGSATGQRYLAFLNGVISVNAAGATYLPGNVGGGTATGGQYA